MSSFGFLVLMGPRVPFRERDYTLLDLASKKHAKKFSLAM